jgi:hypothetical protein
VCVCVCVYAHKHTHTQTHTHTHTHTHLNSLFSLVPCLDFEKGVHLDHEIVASLYPNPRQKHHLFFISTPKISGKKKKYHENGPAFILQPETVTPYVLVERWEGGGGRGEGEGGKGLGDTIEGV